MKSLNPDRGLGVFRHEPVRRGASPPSQEPDRRGRPLRGQRADRARASRSSTSAAAKSSRPAICPAPRASRAAISSRASRAPRPTAPAELILYCASGNRSAYAARTLQEDLGYEHVRSMTGGITLWKDRGYEVEVPRALSAEQRERYSRHLLIPEIGAEGQQKLLDAKVLLLGAGGLGSPTALYLAAAGVGTLGIVDDDVGRPLQPPAPGDPRHRPHRHPQGRFRRADDPRAQPRRQGRQVPDAHRRVEHHGDHRGLRRDRRRRRQLPHALPAQRRERAPADPRGLRVDPRLRRAAVGVQALRRPLLPLPVPRAAAGRARALVRRQRRARRAARHDGPAAGDRGRQADPRASASPRSGGCCCTTRSGRRCTEVKVHRDPECPICSRDPDEIADEEMGVFPDYEAFCAAAG